MTVQNIELSLAQLKKVLEKSSDNKYADGRKENFAKKLYELFNLIEKENIQGYSSTELQSTKKYIDFIYSHITFLDFSTLTVIPYELVSCLEEVLHEWVPNGNYIVVTSLESNLLSYSFDGSYALNDPLFFDIETKYKITFENRLIQIRLPKHYVRDYLVNVVLYHELGHFIDLKYSISQLLINKMITGKSVDRTQYFQLIRHHMEYFADIFAAQYVSHTSNYFLNYIAYNNPASPTHPATLDRISIVNEFLAGAAPSIVTDFEAVLNSRSPVKNFSFRFRDLDPTDFYALVPMELNEQEIHSIFVLGWRIWLDSTSELRSRFDSFTAYKIINNLIEKSLSNHFVKKHWNI